MNKRSVLVAEVLAFLKKKDSSVKNIQESQLIGLIRALTQKAKRELDSDLATSKCSPTGRSGIWERTLHPVHMIATQTKSTNLEDQPSASLGATTKKWGCPSRVLCTPKRNRFRKSEFRLKNIPGLKTSERDDDCPNYYFIHIYKWFKIGSVWIFVDKFKF